MSENVQDVLKSARSFIERGWTQGTVARTASNEPVLANDSRAVCWCAFGAIYAAIGDHLDLNPARHALYDALSDMGADDMTPPMWNDEPGRTKEEVLALFDRAITIAGENREQF